MFFRQRRIWSLHVVRLQRRAKKSAQRLFCSFLFSNVPVAVGVVVFINSLKCDTPVVGSMFYTNPRLGKQKNVNHFSDERKQRFDKAADIFNL